MGWGGCGWKTIKCRAESCWICCVRMCVGVCLPEKGRGGKLHNSLSLAPSSPNNKSGVFAMARNASRADKPDTQCAIPPPSANCHPPPPTKKDPVFVCTMLAHSLSLPLLWRRRKDETIVEEIKHHFCRSKIDTRDTQREEGYNGEFDFGTGVGAAGALLGPVGCGTVRSRW